MVSKETLEKQGEQIANEIGLKVHKDKITGTSAIINQDSLVVGEWPEELVSAYHASLDRKIISQEVVSTLKNIDVYLGVFSKEEWTNGLKNIVFQGITGLTDWKKDVVIEDWNPADNSIFELTYTRQFQKEISMKFPTKDLIEAFTTPANLASFTNKRIKVLSDTFSNFLQELHLAIVGNKTGAPIQPNHQIVVDVPVEATNEDVLRGINKLIELYSSSFPLTVPGFIDQSIKTSGASLKTLIDLDFKSKLTVEVAAKYFNAEILKLSELKTVPFADKQILVGTSNVSPLVIITDNSKFKTGFDVEGTQIIEAPHQQKVITNHKWFGFASYPFKVSIIMGVGLTSANYGQTTILGNEGVTLANIQFLTLADVIGATGSSMSAIIDSNSRSYKKGIITKIKEKITGKK